MLKAWAKAQLARGLQPHELALAVAVGCVCAFFPILGLATPLCLLAGFALRLNHPVIQAVNGLTAPLYPPLVFLFVRLGAGISRSPMPQFHGIGLPAILHARPEFLGQVARGLGEALVGWAILSVLALPAVYLLVRGALQFKCPGAPFPFVIKLKQQPNPQK